MRSRTLFACLVVLALVTIGGGVRAASPASSLSFTNTPLLRPDGNSEPAISIASNGVMALTGLSWLQFGTNLWTGPFGSTPPFQGVVDGALQQPGRRVFGGGDADVDLGSTGTLHASTLIFLVNSTFTSYQLGVSAITCPGATASFTLAGCTSQIIDTAGADRQWITSDGPRVYISYHDAGNSTLIHAKRSDDDGFTWKNIGDPIVGQGSATGDSTFNNDQGPLVADPSTHNVYAIYAAGQAGIQKATSASFNNIYVSRSTDGGMSWQATLVYTAPLFTALNNVFPALAVDPTNGTLYATWSDAHLVYFSSSSDQGQTWTPAATVNASPAVTAVFPWVAAYNGVVDIVYYGTTAASDGDTSAVWNVYLARPAAGGFAQTVVSNHPNHVGVICTGGTSCAPGTRNLLDLFEVAIDPATGQTGVIYTDDTISQDSSGNPLPQVVLAQQKK